MKFHGFLWVLIGILAVGQGCCFSQNPVPDYQNMQLSVERRVDDMVGRMTLDEKVSQIRSSSAAIPRLGIPAYEWWAECLHGVTRPGNEERATCFPQAIGMAASFNPELLGQVAEAISSEARARHHHDYNVNGLTFFTPNINIIRDPRWGRSLETYGEDPYLTSVMGVSFIKGLQGDDPRYYKIIATAKHYAAHSGPESKRRGFNAIVTERDLWETYLPAFHAAVTEAKAASVMTAYNAFNGVPCTANSFLIEEVLREKWHFQGYVVSDDQSASDVFDYHRYADSQKAGGAKVINNGCDIELGQKAFAELAQAVRDGLVSEERVTEACKRALTARFKLGMFDNPKEVEYARIPYSVVGSQKHKDLALQMARESMVLLKNEDNCLPLNPKKYRKVAVIGPNANDPVVMTSNYFWSTPTEMITPYEGVRQRLEGAAEVSYTPGCSRLASTLGSVVIPSAALLPMTDQENRQGLEAEYFSNSTFTGTPAAKRIDQEVNFDWEMGSPMPQVPADEFSVRWQGRLKAPVSGQYVFTTQCDDGSRLWLNGQLMIDDWTEHPPREVVSTPVQLEAGQSYSIKMEYLEAGGGAVAQLKWVLPREKGTEYAEAVKAAQESDLAIVVLGLMSREGHPETSEGEWDDRKGGIVLNNLQENLLKAVHATKTPTVLVLVNGGPLTSVWAHENISGILEAWYPGQAGGRAIAEVLFGDYNPGGKLPVTFYASNEELPDFDDYHMTAGKGRTYRYYQGQPLYPFGYGLSYTQFKYANLKVSSKEMAKDGKVTVSCDITNTGDRDGEEIVQLYVRDIESTLPMPVKQLRAFKRLALEKSQTKTATFTLTAEKDMHYYNVDQQAYDVEPGQFELQIGASSQDIRLKDTVYVR